MPKATEVLGVNFDDSNPKFTLLNYGAADGDHALKIPKEGPLHLLYLLTALLLKRQDRESQEALQKFALKNIMAGVTPHDTMFLRYQMEAGFEFVTGFDRDTLQTLHTQLGKVLDGTAVKADPQPGYFANPNGAPF